MEYKEVDMTNTIPKVVYTEDDIIFTEKPTLEMIEFAEELGKLMIAFARLDDCCNTKAYMEQHGLRPSTFLYLYGLTKDMTVESAKQKILDYLNAEGTMWFAPAGLKRGILSSLELSNVEYVQDDSGIEGYEVVCDKTVPLKEPVLDTAQQVLDHIDKEVKKACENVVFEDEHQPEALQEAVKVWGQSIISNPRTMNKINMRRIIMMKPEITQSGKQFIIKYMHNTYIIKHQRKRVRVKRATNFYQVLLKHWGLIARKCLGSEIEFKVICDETNNSEADCLDGKMNVTICITNKVRPEAPVPCTVCNGYGGIIDEEAGLDNEGQPFWKTCDCQRDYDAEDALLDRHGL
jgi:hypothetical protein